MWNLRKKELDGPLAFYKIGHHGSINATPWGMRPPPARAEPLAILDAILPVGIEGEGQGRRFDASRRLQDHSSLRPARGDRQAGFQHEDLRDGVQEARHLKTSTVPKFTEFEKTSFDKPQPLRTDLERMLQEARGFVDVEIEA